MSVYKEDGNKFLAQVHNLKSAEDCRDLYNDWAETYDTDVYGAEDYVAPMLVAKAVQDNKGNVAGDVFDAGCGTGLVGVALAGIGAKSIDGVDVSPGMLKVAEKTGVYRLLEQADLSRAITKYQDESYDVVTCVGTLTDGHVGPVPAMREFVRIVKQGGLVVATVREDVWESRGYEAETDRLKSDGLVDVVSAENAEYMRAAGVKARVLVLRKR